MNLPLILGQVVTVIISGAAVGKFGYCTPFMIASSIVAAIGAGLLSTFEVSTGTGKWIGFQLLFGLGVGLGFQLPLVAIQGTLDPEDIPIGTAITVFAQTIGGAIFISVGQNVFTNGLLRNLAKAAPSLSPGIVLATGATELKNAVPPDILPEVQIAYNGAIIQAFYVAIAMAAVSLVGAAFVEWKNIKGQGEGVALAA